MENTTTGAGNVAVGSEAFKANTTGAANTGVGYRALYSATTADNNTAFGSYALDAVTTGGTNVAIGASALTSNTASNNAAVGFQALEDNTSGTENTAMGVSAAYNITTGSYNSAFGSSCLSALTTGSHNLSVGRASNQISTTGSFNIMLGPLARPSAADGNSETVVGYNVVGQGNSTFTLGGGTAISSIAWGATTWTAPSDERVKEEIEDEVVGLSFINDLRPRTFRFRKEKDIPEELEAHVADSEKRYKTDKYEHGFVAQEVKEAIDKHNLKDGFDMWSEDAADGRQRVGPTAVIPMLIKAIQELSAEVEKLKGE